MAKQNSKELNLGDSDNESGGLDPKLMEALESKVNNFKEKRTERIRDKDPYDLWTFDRFRPQTCSLFIGQSKSGKTYLLRYIMNYLCISKKMFQAGICFFGSASMSSDYDYLPKYAVMNGFDEDKLKQWLRKLEAIKLKTGKFPATFIILDDIVGMIKKSDFLDAFMSKFRHWNITIFIAVQYLKTSASGTLVRAQVNQLFAFRCESRPTIQMIHEYWGQAIGNEKDFRKKFMEQTKDDHSCMLWIEGEKNVNKNFLSVTAPPNFKSHNIKF